MRSKLCNIIAACFTFAKDLNQGLQSNFHLLVNEFKKLEETGISFVIGQETVQVYFVLSYIHGDNLGLNSLLGYIRSFRTDGCCRKCIATYVQIKTLVIEDPALFRNTYDNRINMIGVEQNCPFEDINSFFTVDNCSVDVFHDINEGVLHTELIYCMKQFIKDGFIDLKTINIRKNNFKFYTVAEKNNMCVDINKEHLKKKKLKMSGSEIATFFKYFPLFVGEFIPQDNTEWALVLSLYKMMNLSYKDSFSQRDIDELRQQIIEHHTLYKDITSNNLTFKHHNLSHYPSIIRELSPPKKMSTIRMEGFHKVSKAYSNCTTSRKNIVLSLAEKHQYHHIYQLKKDKTFKAPQVNSKINGDDLINQIRNRTFLQSVGSNVLVSHEKLTYYDVTYTISNAIQHCEEFLRINFIVTLKDKISLVCSKLEIDGLDSHLSCTTVNILTSSDHVIVNVDDLNSLPFSCFEYNVQNSLHSKNKTVLMITHF